MQRVAGQYVVKKFADTLLRDDPPAQQPEQNQPNPQYQQPNQPQAAAPAAQPTGGEMDGALIRDDDGNRLGIARHVANVSVYVIAHANADRDETLQQAINDPDMELRLATDGSGRVTGLIYVPSTARAAQNIRGTRLDDV